MAVRIPLPIVQEKKSGVVNAQRGGEGDLSGRPGSGGERGVHMSAHGEVEPGGEHPEHELEG